MLGLEWFALWGLGQPDQALAPKLLPERCFEKVEKMTIANLLIFLVAFYTYSELNIPRIHVKVNTFCNGLRRTLTSRSMFPAEEEENKR